MNEILLPVSGIEHINNCKIIPVEFFDNNENIFGELKAPIERSNQNEEKSKIWTFKIVNDNTKIEKKIRKRRKKNDVSIRVNFDRFCSHCGATNTPEWRRGPNGVVTLCNACGLLYRKGIQYDLSHEVSRKMSISRLLN